MSEHERPIGELRINPNNPRHAIERNADFDSLVASIKAQGILQPLLITDSGMVLAGHRRLYAAIDAGIETVPVRVLPEGEGIDLELVPLLENLMRTDLTVMETADYLASYQDKWESTPAEISQMTGITTSTVQSYLKIARAPEKLKSMIASDKLPMSAALEALRHGDEVVDLVTRHHDGLSHRQVKEIAKTRAVRPDPSYIEKRQADISWSLDKIEEIRTRLAPHSDKDFAAAVAVQVKTIENHLKDALLGVTTLANSIMDWSAIVQNPKNNNV